MRRPYLEAGSVSGQLPRTPMNLHRHCRVVDPTLSESLVSDRQRMLRYKHTFPCCSVERRGLVLVGRIRDWLPEEFERAATSIRRCRSRIERPVRHSASAQYSLRGSPAVPCSIRLPAESDHGMAQTVRKPLHNVIADSGHSGARRCQQFDTLTQSGSIQQPSPADNGRASHKRLQRSSQWRP